jgi:glyoxylate/hydroxypyruvate reductase A
MVLVIKSGGEAAFADWQAAFAECAPHIDVRAWDDPTVPLDEVAYALVWEPTPGRLAAFPRLRAILSAAAGVDHILADPLLPAHLPIVRMVTPETGARMAEFLVFAALGLNRDLPSLIAAQREASWQDQLTGRLAADTTVGIMGLGQLGSHAATRLAAAGFQVAGWARSEKSIAGVSCHAGAAGLAEFLGRTDILINLLPQTDATRGIIDAAALARLRPGASVINVGRGSHLDHAALLAALDSGHLRAALLDVFAVEPLPADDPLWRHPKVIVTPHIASTVSRRTRAQQAARSIAADLAGAPLAHLYDRAAGY